MQKRAERGWLVAILVVAAAVRLAWLWYIAAEAPEIIVAGDQYSYWYYGHEIAAGRGYVSYTTGTASAYYPIGFPVVLAGVFWLARHTFLPGDLQMAQLFQVALATATVWFVYLVARRLFDTRTALIAAAIFAAFPNAVYYVGGLAVEPPFMFLTMGAIAIAVTHDWSCGPASTRRLAVFGAVLAASVLVRPFSVWLVAGVLGAFVAIGAGWRRSLIGAAIPLAIVVAAGVPWTIRNAVALDAFVPSSTNMGDTLCLDRNRDATGTFRWSGHDGCVDPSRPEAERNSGNTRKAISFVVHHPAREVLQIVRRARYTFANDSDGVELVESLGARPRARAELRAAADWYFFAVAALAVAGLRQLGARSPRPERRLFLSGLVALIVVPLLLWGTPRFHQPLLPFLAVLAAAPLAALVRARSGRGEQSAGGPDPVGAPGVAADDVGDALDGDVVAQGRLE